MTRASESRWVGQEGEEKKGWNKTKRVMGLGQRVCERYEKQSLWPVIKIMSRRVPARSLYVYSFLGYFLKTSRSFAARNRLRLVSRHYIHILFLLNNFINDVLIGITWDYLFWNLNVWLTLWRIINQIKVFPWYILSIRRYRNIE